ncbi:hypothetical protein MMC22_011713 [Lobaria immixta]|nr:hypothetical protein [Lobaria immixta]
MSLTEDEIDDLLYYARNGQLDDFRASIEAFARTSNTSHYEVVRAAVDHQSGNSSLHMASANGHSNVLNYVLATIHPASREPRAPTLNVQNASGNTPLHWASLNGHLEAVKILMAAGADPSVTNQAGHDAVYEAEINSEDAVVKWFLTQGNGSESDDAVNEDPPDHQVDGKANEHEIDQDMGKLSVG